jgi:pyruvate dehydrogenase E2 component (dihydrolipoamide acetyltransferase)
LLADDVHVGVAVAVTDGLIAPAILDCAGLGVLMISRRLRDLANRARIGKLRVDEINQPTFTISNLGMYEVSRFTAILNPPQVAILATGTVEQRAVVVDGVVVPGSVIAMTLSADHRAIDGIAAAQFLATVRRGLEMPSGLDWGTAG